MASDSRIDVIYVLGTGHSGSTLLDLILGSHSQIESVGEIAVLGSLTGTESSLVDRRLTCTCGMANAECDYWRAVRQGVADRLGAKPASRAEEDVGFGVMNRALFASILDYSNRRFICDSSKGSERLEGLIKSGRFNVLVVHLVRDSRAVAYSQKKKGRSPYRSAARWQKSNTSHRFRFDRPGQRHRYIRVKYEELTDDPRDTISRILGCISLEFEEGQLEFWLGDHHNISGNRMRHAGRQPIVRDMSYVESLNRKEWSVCTALSLLGLRLFGYPIRKDSLEDGRPAEFERGP